MYCQVLQSMVCIVCMDRKPDWLYQNTRKATAIYAHNQWAGALSATLKIIRCRGHCHLRQRRGNRMGRSLAKSVVNPTGGVGRDQKGSWRINLVTGIRLLVPNAFLYFLVSCDRFNLFFLLTDCALRDTGTESTIFTPRISSVCKLPYSWEIVITIIAKVVLGFSSRTYYCNAMQKPLHL